MKDLITVNKNDYELKKIHEEMNVKMINDFKNIFGKMKKKTMKELYFTNIAYKNKNFGYVYFLHNKDTKLTKIGYTMNLVNRMKTIRQTFRNYIGVDPNLEITTLLYSHQSLLSKVEKDLHGHLFDCKRYGEWFDLNDSTVISELVNVEYVDVEGACVVIDDCHDFHLYEEFEDEFNFTVEDTFNYFSTEDTPSYTFNESLDFLSMIKSKPKNKYLEIYETCVKNNIGLKTYESNAENNEFITREKGLKVNDSNVIYDINTLKKESFDLNQVKEAINSLKHI